MNLKSISINNYRGTKDAVDIPLGAMSIFVGKNDSGKSIALSATAVLLDVKNYPVDNVDFNDPAQPIILEGRLESAELQTLVSAKIGSKIKKDDGKQEFVEDATAQKALFVRKKIEKEGKAYASVEILMRDFAHEDFSKLHERTDAELDGVIEKHSISIPATGKGRNSKLEKIKHIRMHCERQGIETTSAWVDDQYKLADLAPQIELFKSDYGIEADTAFKTTSVTEAKGVFEQESTRLESVATKIKAEMTKESQAISEIMRSYVPSVESVTITPNLSWKDAVKSVDVNFKFNDDSREINMTRKGSGYRRLFMVARFRYLAEKKKGESVIYAIEEPETFLHPSAQEDLLSALMEISTESQILIATHSPVFAGSSDQSSVVLCEKTPDGSKYFTQNDDASIPQRIIQELGIKPAYNLRDTYDKILFCESKNDIQFYDTIAKKLFNKSLLGNETLLCLPGNGSSLEDIINISYFRKTQRKLFLITDSDKHLGEVDQKKNIDRKTEFEQNPQAKGYILQKACIENYYHPRALERIYRDLPANTCDIAADTDDMRKMLREISKQHSVDIKFKNDHRVFRETTKDEWCEILESELVDFLADILN